MNHQVLVLSFIVVVLNGCAGGEQTNHHTASDGDSVALLSSSHSPQMKHPVFPPAIQANLTLIGAIVQSVQLIDERNYSLSIELRTAIPAGGFESIAEPGQSITVIPSFVADTNGNPDMGNERNARLLAVRLFKPGDFLMGKVSLGQDGKWYLIETELE